MVSKFLLTIFFCVCFLNVKAQVYGLSGFIRVGSSTVPGSKHILERVSPNIDPVLNNHFFTLGAEGYYRSHRTILGLEGSLGRQVRRREDNDYYAYNSSALLRVGQLLHDGRFYWIYPSVGAGISTLGLTHSYRAETGMENINARMLLTPSFDLSMNADLLQAARERKKKFDGMILGLRTGFRFAPRSARWRDANGTRVNDLPAFKRKEYYFSLCFGGGGISWN